MSNSEKMKDFFVYKTACLLHDPPNKPWLLRHHKSHEKEAEKMAREILQGTLLEAAAVDMETAAKNADSHAASFDRWLLSILIEGQYSILPTSEIELKNIFNPKYCVKLPTEISETSRFAENLNDVLSKLGDAAIAYHVLYALYESEWALQGLPSGPADTRAPTHTVFDHNYATAAVANWLYRTQKPDGILLHIDLGGIQKFISSSRKLIDLWSSSYLASALTWRLLWTFIKPLGPDVALLPTCRGNPFYYHSLIAELHARKENQQIIEKLKQVAKTFLNYDTEHLPYPRYAVIPATASLMLPHMKNLKEFEEFKQIRDENPASLEDFLKTKYEETWRKLYDTVIQTCREFDGPLQDFMSNLATVLESCRQYGFDTVPPLPLLVVAVTTNSVAENEVETYMIYDKIFRKLFIEKSRRKIYRESPEERLKLYDMTVHGFKTYPRESSKGFDYCSVCGKLPAVIIVPTDDEDFEKKATPSFTAGERLCPYCLIKRLMLFEKIRTAVIHELLGKIPQPSKHTQPTLNLTRYDLKMRDVLGVELRFPSVSDVAAFPFLKSLIQAAKEADQDVNAAPFLVKLLDEAAKDTRPPQKLPKNLTIIGIHNNELKEWLEYLISADSETLFLKHSQRWNRLRRRLAEHDKLRETQVQQLTTYYALVKIDSDNFGKIISGEIEKSLNTNLRQYLVNMLEGDAKQIMESILNDNLEQAIAICKLHNITQEKLERIRHKVQEKLSEDGGRLVLSPAFHAALSRASMATAVRDCRIVEDFDGIAIYAGGDDLLAVTPVIYSLRALKRLRKEFSFPSDRYDGFDEIGKGGTPFLVPSVVTAGRSAAVYLGHYMFPLYVALNRISALLEEDAKEATWIRDGVVRQKDSVVLVYSPRGGESKAILPLFDFDDEKNLAEHVQTVADCINDVESEKFSASLIYDLLKNLPTIESLANVRAIQLFESYLRHVFERNTRSGPAQKQVKANEWTQYLSRFVSLNNAKDGERTFFTSEWIRALVIYRSGLRGSE